MQEFLTKLIKTCIYSSLIVFSTFMTPYVSVHSVFAQELSTEAGFDLGENLGESYKGSNRSSKNFFYQVLMYAPNRVFDLLDIVRLRARLGPGIQLGAQITKPVRIKGGTHASIWVGLPGPRQEPLIPIPIGAQTSTGAALSVLEIEAGKDTGPPHSYSEIAAEAQLVLVGADVGIDFVELADFFGGFLLYDIRKDDF